MELIIENIRCFAGRHTIPIKPITFLTGENSSGKSTFLAALSAVTDFGFPVRPRFNKSPYNLGNFDTISTYKGGSYGRAKTFSLGSRKNQDSDDQRIEVIATYKERKGLVDVSVVELKNKKLKAVLTVTYTEKGIKVNVKIQSDGRNYEREIDSGSSDEALIYRLPMTLFHSVIDTKLNDVEMDQLIFVLDSSLGQLGNAPAMSIAPVRTKPSRTYDQLTEEFSPEGEHIPFVLSDVLADPKNKGILDKFGREAGLFREISVKKLGSKLSDPVQVMVTNSGRPANLVDVGYGVSQALPIVVESMLVSPQRLLLIQQPEVHLHPRAQAALGTLFVDLHQSNGKQFVIETHSDYIIDRVRQEVAKGHILADDVQILYFEKTGTDTKVFPIQIDNQGNVVNPPPSYRDFFFQEEVNLLSRVGA